MNALSVCARLTLILLFWTCLQSLSAQSHKCDVAGAAGCDDAVCEDFICNLYPMCCTVEWDAICASEAAEFCAYLCGRNNKKVTICHVSPQDASKCKELCLPMNALAEHLAHGDLLGPCTADCLPTASLGSCCEEHGTPGCDDAACQALVCDFDPFCCDTLWDALCVAQAEIDCGTLCESNCCTVNEGPGCDNATCEAEICALDPFCCNTQWDATCAAEAAITCTDICVNPAVVEGTRLSQAIAVVEAEIINAGKRNAPDTDYRSYDPAVSARIADEFLLVYPNPASEQVQLDFHWPRSAQVQIDLYDASGQPVETLYDGSSEAGSRLHRTVEVSRLPAGLYVVKCTLDSGRTLHQRLLVQH